MRILYLVYAPQRSFSTFCENGRTNFPWVDSLLRKIKPNPDLDIALAIPINEKEFRKEKRHNITLYGLPNPPPTSRFRKIYNRMSHKIESEKINSYVTKAVSDFNPNIIQIFGSENPFGLIINADQQIPVIIHIQGFLVRCADKWFSGITKWQQFRYTGLKELLTFRGFYHDYFVFRKRAKREIHILKNCKHYIGRTDFDRSTVGLFSPSAEYYHCEEMIRPDFFEKEWDLPENDQKIVLVSILNGMPYKGIELLLKVSMILSKYLPVPFEIRVCGVSENEKMVKLLKKIYGKQCDFNKIKFLGRLSANELVSELSAANLYVHPSHIENSPNSICEAMALGMPVISTNVGGVTSILDDKKEGILVQEGNSSSMAEAIVKLIKERDYARNLGKNARLKAIERHNPEMISHETLNIYKSLIGRDHSNTKTKTLIA